MSIIDKDLDQTNNNKYNSFILDSVNSKNFELNFKIIFNHELKVEFQNILLFEKDNFIDSVKKKVLSVLIDKYSNKISDNCSVISILDKYIQKLNKKYDKNYINISKQYNIFKLEKEKFKHNKSLCLSKYYFSSHRKHCSNASNYAMHLCNNKKRGIINTGRFIKIKNDINIEKVDYLVCENCQKSFFTECFNCYCQFCKEMYFSSTLNSDEKKYLLPATLKYNHCEIVINEILNCPQCKKPLYLNLNSNMIQCTNEKCKKNIISKNTEWKCKNCSKYFNSDFKVYNPLEIKILSEEINYSLTIKIKAKPNILPCCKYTNLNVIDFYHSQKCDGLIYFGSYNQKKFIICEKCKAINFLEKFIWTCPKCKCRFREIKENEKSNYFNLNNNKSGMIYQIKDLNEKINSIEIKKISNLVEKRKNFAQEYDYDDSNSKNINYNDENCDINIIKIDYDSYKKKNNNKLKVNLNNEDNLSKRNIYDYKKSRNNNDSNNIIYSKLLNKKISSIISDEKDKNKNAKFNLTSNDFYSERYKKDFNDKNNKKKLIKINLINLNSINKYSINNKNNDSAEKRHKKYFIPHSKYNKNKIESSKNVKNISFCESNNFVEKKKNYTPCLSNLKRGPLKYEKSNNIVNHRANISNFNITNEKKGNIKMRNRSPFLLRRMLNFSIGNISIEKDIKKEIKFDDKYKNKNDKKNNFYLRLKSSSNVEINDNNNNDKSNNSNNSFLIRKSIYSSENNKNKRQNLIKNNKENKENKEKESEKNNIISKKYNFPNKNMKSKSENKIKESTKNDKEKPKCKNISIYQMKQNKEEKSLKPKDILEASKIDLSKDIPIINEAIHKDKKLYEEIQTKLKSILSKGKLPLFFLENYTVTRQLGEGSFGTIFEVYNNETKIKYAIKKILATNLISLQNYQKEFEIVHENKHPNILDIYGVCIRCYDTTTYLLYVLMDKAEKDWETEINERAKIKNYYTEKELISILKQLVNALCFLQKEKNIAHRDIKPENILLFKNNVCKVADFGEAKKSKDNKFRTLRGTEFYMSPILYNNLKNKNDYVRHNPYKSDVFSLGYCMVCATALNFNIIEKIRERSALEIKRVLNLYFLKIYSNKYMELILKMIEHSEDKRVDFIQLNEILKRDF